MTKDNVPPPKLSDHTLEEWNRSFEDLVDQRLDRLDLDLSQPGLQAVRDDLRRELYSDLVLSGIPHEVIDAVTIYRRSLLQPPQDLIKQGLSQFAGIGR